MTRVELTELGPGHELPLSPEQGRLLAESGVVSAVPSAYVPGHWLLASAGKVGAARIGDIELHIKPKVPIARLLFLLGYSHHGAGWRPESVPLAETAELVPAFAQAVWRQTSRAIHQGLLPGYIQIEESSQVLRGRLRESEQLHRHHGLPLPLEIRHDEFTVDIPENQILRAACERMLAIPRVDVESQRMLRRLLRDFTDVTPLSRGDPVPAWQATRINARYHTALRLAELVLDATSVEHRFGGVAVNGFLLDMPRLFEDFVTVALREELVPAYGGRVGDQDRNHFDEGGQVLLRPDIVWKVRGSPVAVIDAKYKAEKPTGYPNADLYQLLAYTTVLGLRHGHLVYANGNEEPAHHIVRRSAIEIFCHAVDLSQDPRQLLSQMRELAERIAAMRPRTERTRLASGSDTEVAPTAMSQGYLKTPSWSPLIRRMNALSWGTTSGSESSARSSWLTSCGVSRRIRSSASTVRARSIAAPRTNDVRSCCCTPAAARTVSSASGLSRRLIRADLASDMTDASFSWAMARLYVSETYKSAE